MPVAVRRSVISLSDGRELIYFDQAGAPERNGIDARGLEPGSTAQGSMRFDALTGEWVAVAGHRQTRIFLPSASDCPICPTRDGWLSEIPEPAYDVVVFENRFPSFLTGTNWETSDVFPELGTQIPAHGRCEVVAFTDNHVGSIASVTTDQMSLVMSAWIDRTRELSARDGIRYVFVFENRGAEIGVTLHHPHGQIYAYPYLPATMSTQLRQSAEYFDKHGRQLLESMVAFELNSGDRIIFEDELWVAFVPFAARWPYEIQIHPKAHRTSLTELTDAEQDAFCASYPRLIRALDSIFDMPLPYMSGWHQLPAQATPEELRDSRLFLKLISNRRAADKLKFLAGSESLMGSFINDVAAEQSAQQIREAFEATV